ncbi:hypothetical protein [Kitasatospora sp. GAS204B]|nr:hypothetical protein [Kitasatospora sp. GAS204B]MDH6120016.1 hypothetical protein [Kitasatospora sp. GAS204B]
MPVNGVDTVGIVDAGTTVRVQSRLDPTDKKGWIVASIFPLAK